jgi:hypothetical protein
MLSTGYSFFEDQFISRSVSVSPYYNLNFGTVIILVIIIADVMPVPLAGLESTF